jgi:rfaE bifunctional protein nucleotidyltransferase chain/domain
MKKIIVNGTFDILHRGHINLLNYAKSLGNQLLVAIDTDNRVKQLKGNSRPINNQDDRQLLLYNLKSVDIVMTFDNEKDLVNIIKEYNPDIMVKGSDYQGKRIVGQELIPQIIFFDLVNGCSTTNIIQRITDRR